MAIAIIKFESCPWSERVTLPKNCEAVTFPNWPPSPDAGAPPADPPARPDFRQTDRYKRLIQDVANGDKSVGDGLVEAYQAGVSDATSKEPRS